MNASEKAAGLHKQGLNCAQSVLTALDGLTGMDEQTSNAISAGFGGGLRSGECCGAVAGAAMALGLAMAKDGAGAKDAPVASAVKSLVSEFRENFGAVGCRELLEQTGGSHEKCGVYISYCAQLAAAMIEENNKQK